MCSQYPNVVSINIHVCIVKKNVLASYEFEISTVIKATKE